MTTFDGDRGIIALRCADRPRNLIERHTLKNGAVQIDDEMRADPVFVFKIFPILKRGGSGVGNIVDDDLLQCFKLVSGSGFLVDGEIFFCD